LRTFPDSQVSFLVHYTLLISQGDLVRALEAEVGGVLITLRNQVPALGDSLANSPDLLGGTLGGILDNLLGGGLSKLGQ